MKIVCEACQAKYSIADDKVRGKVFKIRCKKCSHVIVVRGSGETGSSPSTEFASSPSSAPDLALDAGWHIVVEGEQVGPLSEGDIRARLARGEITPETYIWKEGLPDWVKVSTLAEFRGEGEAPSPFSGGAADEGFPGGATMVGGGAPAADMFASGGAAAGGGAVPDLFGSPVAAEPPAAAHGRAAAAASYGGYDAPVAADPFAPMGGGGNGAGAAGGMTGQRHENSVLFSLSNLEALAKPNTAPLPAARSPGAASPSTTTTTEGSGLIDIRAMANMTLGAAQARSENKGPDLPAFSAPQFSPVAPVLLAPTHGGGMPRWALVSLLVGVGVLTIFLAIVAVKLLSDPPPAPVVTAPPAATPPAAPAGTAAKAPPPVEKAPPTTPPPAANEELPPREPAKAAGTAGDREDRTRARPGATARRTARAGDGDRAPGAVTPTPRAGAGEAPPPPAPRKPKDDIEALLEQATGNKRSSGGGSAAAPAARREEEEAPRERLPPLSREEVVKGMNSVLPKGRDCYNQYKVPGVAMVKLTVAPSGRVSSANVTGKFAGTPSGTCVEAAVKSAKFAPSSGLTFDYPIPLR